MTRDKKRLGDLLALLIAVRQTNRVANSRPADQRRRLLARGDLIVCTAARIRLGRRASYRSKGTIVATGEHEGRRVRLRRDATLHSFLRTYLTDEQQWDGAEGVILPGPSEGDRETYSVKFENVPRPVRVLADDCDLIADA